MAIAICQHHDPADLGKKSKSLICGRTVVEHALLRDILTQAASFLVLNSSYLNDTGQPQHNIPIRLVLSIPQVELEDLTSI